MSVLMPYIYLNAARRTDVQAALGGQVWWEGQYLCWHPEGMNQVVRIPYRDLTEATTIDEWVEIGRASCRERV